MTKDLINILDLVGRKAVPEPWAEGDNIPWSEPGFSERMLKQHLSQAHDLASRRFETIDTHIAWIHQKLLEGKQSKILDLGCGPGFYAGRLAKLGHECVGIDYSPASIKYAAEQAGKEKLICNYLHEDIRKAEFNIGFDLVMLIYGELNVFRPADATAILKKANRALSEHGILLLEPHSFGVVKSIGEQPSSWYSAKSGLFSDKPHICLEEGFWDGQSNTSTKRYFIIDASTVDVAHYATTYQAYTDQQYSSLLKESGFEAIEFYPSLGESKDKYQEDLIAIVAKKSNDGK
ncbi:MAG TPA: class I SAM-dependent methyltransferase [Planctomycetes bacterium]|nr:class I SAM-dependent methyltransferase [Planctomycetota bacterium]HIJ70031.1 class I SAM-dependent methyltransferase [Planctomycetota bacterium]